MENTNENPVTEPEVFETPVIVEEPVVEEWLAPVVEEPTVQEPVAEDVHVEEPKAVEPEAPADVIHAPAYPSQPEVQALGNVNGAIGATTAPVTKKVVGKKAAEPKDTVAIRSTKNVTWPGVGKVYTGINIVEKDAAEKWLTRSHITVATPEEVAKEFGK
jgi:hypothetical protein